MTPNHAARWILAATLTIAGGCSIAPKPTTVQLLDPRPETGLAPAAESLPWSLTVTRPETDPTRDSNRVMVRTPDGRLQVHSSARWIAPAPELFRTLLVRHLRDRELLSQVGTTTRDSDGTLTIDLRRFELADHGGAPTVEIDADARLYDSDSGELLGRRLFEARHPLASSDAASVTGGFEAALADLLPDIGAWVIERATTRQER